MYSLNSKEPVTLRPGVNTVVVEALAGHVGRCVLSFGTQYVLWQQCCYLRDIS